MLRTSFVTTAIEEHEKVVVEEYSKFLDRTGGEVEVVEGKGGESEAFERRINDSNHLILARSIFSSFWKIR